MIGVEILPDGMNVTEADNRAGRVATQAIDLGFGELSDGVVRIPWDGVYALLAIDPTAGAALGLPPVDSDLVPSLNDNGTTLGDGFRVSIDGWCSASDGRRIVEGVPRPTGPIVELGASDARMLSETAWRVVEGVRAFAHTRRTDASASTARRAWAGIGRDARACNAPMTHSLRMTIVVGVDHLDLKVARTGASGVFEIRPTFDGAPDGWLGSYDRRSDVPELYRITAHGVDYEVLLDNDVRDVLSEVKRELPHRRVAGVRAQRMIRNPFAYFGDRSGVLRDDVVDAQIEQLEQGVHRFEVTADLLATPVHAGVAIDAVDEEHEDELVLWESPAQAAAFARIIDRALGQGASIVRWRGRDLLLDIDDSAAQAEIARMIAERWTAIERPIEAAADDVQVDEPELAPLDAATAHDDSKTADDPIGGDDPVHAEHVELPGVSRRIEGFGVERQYAIIRVPSREGWPGWLPEKLQDALHWPTDAAGNEEPAASESELTITANDIDELRRAIHDSSESSVQLNDAEVTLTREEAQQLLDAIDDPEAVAQHADSEAEADTRPSRATLSLIATPNIDTVEYVTHRADLTVPADATARRPVMLDDWVELRPHQNECLKWLQHLWSLGEHSCNGALLADDMGLGKTLQALSFIASTREEAEHAGNELPPALVIAPVTLLENWLAEIRRFFGDDNLIAAPTHGTVARSLRAAPHEIPDELVEKGITQLLRPGWTRQADVVLSTYETVRDYEYSFATQPWSVVVVDEAQAIKNPNAARTRAIVKLNARFCLACTGTPVETSLTDLWSIFNFVQPSLLGSANDFGRRFKKAIASGGDEREARITELRALIEPQKLRRMKSEVAGDLPPKIHDQGCLAIPMTEAQESDYLQTARGGAGDGAAGMLQTIHRLRRICSDYSSTDDPLEREEQSLAEARRDSAKLDWLIHTLEEIQQRGEKVLVFAEHLDIQRRLKRFIDEQFGLDVAVINGSTSTASGSDRSRQNLINAFSDPSRDGVFDAMVLSPIAAGVGLNIQAANHVIHFQRHWNPAKEDQATDRAYRIGQTRPVTVYTPIVVGSDFTSFDVRLDQLLTERRSLATDMLSPIREVDPSEFASLLNETTAPGTR